MAVTFIQLLLNALFNRKKEGDAIGKTKAQPTTRRKTKAMNKAAKKAYAKSKASLKEKHEKETQASVATDEKLKLEIAARVATRVKNVVSEAKDDEEERIRSCAAEIKNCIDLINSSGGGAPGKSAKDHRRAKTNDRQANKSAGNRKDSDKRNSNKGTKMSKQDVSPEEMVRLLAKAEKNVSEAVVKAKKRDDKKKKSRPGKQT